VIASTVQSPDGDRRFVSLMRDVNRNYRPDFERPDNDAVEAYLMDTASDYQRDVVRQALLASPEFRREILEISEALTDLERTCRPSVVRRLTRRITDRFTTYRYMSAIVMAVFIGLVGLVTVRVVSNKGTERIRDSADLPGVVATDADTIRDSAAPALAADSTRDDRQESPVHAYSEDLKPGTPPSIENSSQEWVWLEPEPWRPQTSVLLECNTITVTGQAPLMENRHQARMLARRRAYYAALAYETGDEPITGHYAALQAVAGDAPRFVADWRPAAIDTGKGDLYNASYTAVVCPGTASDEYAFSAIHLFNQTVLANPRTALFLRSDTKHDRRRRNISDALSGAFLEAGYRIHIPSPDSYRPRDVDALFDAPVGQAVLIGRPADADIVLAVDMSVQTPCPSESNLLDGYRAVDVTVGFRVALPGSGRLVHSGLYTATGLGPSDERARTNAVTKAARQLVRKLMKALPRAIRMYPRVFTIDCAGCTESQFLKIEASLRDAEDVFSLRRNRWDDARRSGSLSVFADPLTGSIDILWMEIRQRLGTPVKLLHRDDERLTLTTFM